jgi:predicted nucleic acid-binding protein
VLEYEAVLVRHAAQLGLSGKQAVGLVDYLCRVAHRQKIHFPWRTVLRDPRDELILELAVTGGCEAIVTDNVRDFGGARPFRVQALTPGEFLALVEEDV